MTLHGTFATWRALNSMAWLLPLERIAANHRPRNVSPDCPMRLPMPHPGLAARRPLWSTLDIRRDKLTNFRVPALYGDSLGIRGLPSEEGRLKWGVPIQ